MTVNIKGYPVEIDEEDAHVLTEHSWHIKRYGIHGYVQRYMPGKNTTTTLHRDLMETPAGFETDHINGNGLDNRRSNLRICTHAENTRNRKIPKNNTSGFVGVCWNEYHKSWSAKIGKERQHLGWFKDPEKAHEAYLSAARERFGDFLRGGEIGG